MVDFYYYQDKEEIHIPDRIVKSRTWRFAEFQDRVMGNTEARCFFTGDKTLFCHPYDIKDAYASNQSGLLATKEHLVAQSRNGPLRYNPNVVLARRDVNTLLGNCPLHLKLKIRNQFYDHRKTPLSYEKIHFYIRQLFNKFSHDGIPYWIDFCNYKLNGVQKNFWTLENKKYNINRAILNKRNAFLQISNDFEDRFVMHLDTVY